MPKTRLWTFSNIVAITSLGVATSSFALTTYFNFLWRQEELSVNFVPKYYFSEIGTDRLNVRVLISNTGKQSAAIDGIFLIQFTGKDIQGNECEAKEVENFPLHLFDYPFQEKGHRLGRLYKIVSPSAVTIGDQPAKTAAALVAPQNIVSLSIEFNPPPFNIDNELNLLHCAAFVYFDRTGKQLIKVFSVAQIRTHEAGSVVKSGSFGASPKSLLPR